MAKKKKEQKVIQATEIPAMDLIEEALQILRRLPASSFLPYLIGVCPFLLGFLFFWSDMARSGLAEQNLIPASLGLAFLFIWMKCWQVLFARQLHAFIYDKELEPLTGREKITLFQRQALWQPTGLFVLIVAALITIPFAAIYACYQNLTVLDPQFKEDKPQSLSDIFKLSRLWNSQNNIALGILFLFAFFLYLSWLSLCIMLPGLAKSLLGVDSTFVRSSSGLFNSTTLSICLVLTYLCIDPIVKTFYFLRCYYGQSRRNGDDLRVSLKKLRKKKNATGATTLAVLTALLFFHPDSSYAQEQTTQQDTLSETIIADSAQFDRAIDRTLAEREYAWRFPRETEANELEENSWFKKLSAWRQQLEDWIRDWFNQDQEDDFREQKESSFRLGEWTDAILYFALFVLIIIIVWFTIKFFRSNPITLENSEVLIPQETVPDLNQEEILADSLPQSRWITLARELVAKGDYRLALRAYFLAQLAHFAEQGLIRIARFKSNRDYHRELSRRGHPEPETLTVYSSEVSLFESVWYGNKTAGLEEVQAMEAKLTALGVLA